MNHYGLKDIQAVLQAVDVKPGSVAMLHSSLMHLGRLDGYEFADCPKAITEALLEYFSDGGTLCAPAPNWDYGKKKEVFDLGTSPVTNTLGALSSYIAEREDSKRSWNPIFSVASIGEAADYIAGGKTSNAFGIDSAWDRLYRKNSEMLFLGCDLSYLTLARYIEFHFGVPYLYNKYFDTPITDNNQVLSEYAVSYVRYQHCPVEYELSRFEDVLREEGALREAEVNGVTLKAVLAQPCFDIGIEMLKKDIYFFLAAPPAYIKDQLPLV